jgi:hypothetical protein
MVPPANTGEIETVRIREALETSDNDGLRLLARNGRTESVRELARKALAARQQMVAVRYGVFEGSDAEPLQTFDSYSEAVAWKRRFDRDSFGYADATEVRKVQS